MIPLQIHAEIEQALVENRAVVALESAVITAGLPRLPIPAPPQCSAESWDSQQPLNLEVARLLQRTIRQAGAVPATIAVIDGILHIGLDDDQLAHLAQTPNGQKTSITDLAYRLTTKATAGTTVSATLAACSLPPSGPIRVFATGGIGGVHRDWTECPDISADLRQLAQSPVCVVSAGAKSILDVPATMEWLEAMGVTVIGYQTDHFPLFLCLGDESIPVNNRLDDLSEVAMTCNHQWSVLGQSHGMLLANPVPADFALDKKEIDQVVNLADSLATARGISGRDRTPFLLAELAQRTSGQSLHANIALLVNNASLAAQLAIKFTTLKP